MKEDELCGVAVVHTSGSFKEAVVVLVIRSDQQFALQQLQFITSQEQQQRPTEWKQKRSEPLVVAGRHHSDLSGEV